MTIIIRRDGGGGVKFTNKRVVWSFFPIKMDSRAPGNLQHANARLNLVCGRAGWRRFWWIDEKDHTTRAGCGCSRSSRTLPKRWQAARLQANTISQFSYICGKYGSIDLAGQETKLRDSSRWRILWTRLHIAVSYAIVLMCVNRNPQNVP